MKKHTEQVLDEYKKLYEERIINTFKNLTHIQDAATLADKSKNFIDKILEHESDIFLFDNDKKLYISSTNDLQIPAKNHLIKYLAKTKELVVYEKIKKWADESKYEDFVAAKSSFEKLNATLIAPIVNNVKLQGFISIQKNPNRDFNRENLIFLGFIKIIIEITLNNIYSQKDATIDVLTKIFNRRYMYSYIYQKILAGESIGLLMCDLNKFKYYNDEFDHKTGDRVLQVTANALKEAVRSGDEVFRAGGDEFVVVLADISAKESELLRSRVLENFNQNKEIISLGEHLKQKITISVGASFSAIQKDKEYTEKEIEILLDELLNKADEKMYIEKKYD